MGEDLESELTAQESQSKDKKKDSKKKGSKKKDSKKKDSKKKGSKKKGSSKKDTKSGGWDLKGTRAPTNKKSRGEEEEIQQDDVLSALLTERNFVADSQK